MCKRSCFPLVVLKYLNDEVNAPCGTEQNVPAEGGTEERENVSVEFERALDGGGGASGEQQPIALKWAGLEAPNVLLVMNVWETSPWQRHRNIERFLGWTSVTNPTRSATAPLVLLQSWSSPAPGLDHF